MKKVTVNNKLNQSFGSTLEDPTEWIADCVANNYWGKSERWVRAWVEKEFAYDEQTNPEAKWFPDEEYDEADVLERESREEPFTLDGNGAVAETRQVEYVKLKAEYEIIIEDITQQIEKDNRIAELKKLLSDSDWTQIPDVAEDKGAEYVDAWKAKRKAWRDEIGGLT